MCKNNIKLTTDEFIAKSKEKHGDKYDYSLVEYKNTNSKVKIICIKHGEFEIRPSHHKNGVGCKKCSDELIRYNVLDTNKFIERSKQIHNDKFDYSLSVYTGIHKNIKIICKEHGVFEQLPNNHFKKLGCPKCSGIKKLTKEEFIERSNIIHGNKFNYDLVEYKNNSTKVKIICPIHGIFEQQPVSHMNNKSGCPNCLNSKGEILIKKILKELDIKYLPQHKFDDCRDKNKLAFDFYLPNKNICIEFDGKQHFEPIKRFGGIVNFVITKNHDEIKNNYCKNNNIKILRIKYTESIEEKLKNILC